MLNSLKSQANLTTTENGAYAFRSTGSACLDLFSSIGALRNASTDRIQQLFIRAYAEAPDDAIRILFYARDIRGGLGERRIFRIILQYLAMYHPESLLRNLENIPEYGRFDDLIAVMDTPCEQSVADMIGQQLHTDIADMQEGKPISLLAKWLPSVNTSSSDTRAWAKRLCKLLHMTERTYRKQLSELRSYQQVLEKQLCVKDYTFDYQKLPSKALYKYHSAFYRNDKVRYQQFLDNVKKGKDTLKTSSLYPYEIVRRCLKSRNKTECDILDTTWNALKEELGSRNAIAVVDGSGSMYYPGNGVPPIAAALSLGLYFAECSEGFFHNHFITFSKTPRLIEVKGKDIYQKVQYCMSYNEISNTDLEGVFILLLSAAVLHSLPQEQLPETIYVISDMEFDEGCSNNKSIFHSMKKRYEKYGYQLPTVVYWNVDSRNEQVPVTKDETGAILVSGFSSSIFAMMINPDMSPEKYMRFVLDSERYCKITA